MLLPHQTPLLAASGFFPELDVEVAHLFLISCRGRGVTSTVAVRIRVAVCSAASVPVAASSSARAASVVDVEGLLLPLAEANGVDIGVRVVLVEIRG